MKNWEKYEKELMAANGYIGIVDGKVIQCYAERYCCERCLFRNGTCGEKRIKWLYSEYEPPKPKLTAREKAFLDGIDHDAFIARDLNGGLYMYSLYPEKESGVWKIVNNYGSFIRLNIELFPFIKWEDEKPWLISDLKNLKVKEGE